MTIRHVSSLALAIALVAALLAPSRARAAAEDCASDGSLDLVCGPEAVEDLVRVDGSKWLIGSGFSPGKTPGAIHAIDGVSRDWQKIYPSADVTVAAEPARYPDCPQPGAGRLSAHGIAIRRVSRATYTLFVVNHTDRESVEVFRLTSGNGVPRLAWVGCVLMPESMFTNGIAAMPDGGFVVTKFFDRDDAPSSQARFAGVSTGGIYRWRPGSRLESIPGSDLPSPNGIETSRDGRTIYVAATGSGEIVRFSLHGSNWRRERAAVGLAVDNLHWGLSGRLVVAGQVLVSADGPSTVFSGWKVLAIDPRTFAYTTLAQGDDRSPMRGVSVGLEVENGIWVGSYSGDRIAFIPRPAGRMPPRSGQSAP